MIIIHESADLDRDISDAEAEHRKKNYSTPHDFYISTKKYKNDYYDNEKKKRLAKRIGKGIGHSIATVAAIKRGKGLVDTATKFGAYNMVGGIAGKAAGLLAHRVINKKYYDKYKDNSSVASKGVDLAKEIL